MSTLLEPADTSYPIYSCPYLWWLINREKLNGWEIAIRVEEMKHWLYHTMGPGNVTGNWSDRKYEWGDGSLEIGYYRFANSIRFTNREDLLAFKLRWGIHV